MYRIRCKNKKGDDVVIDVQDLSSALIKATALGIPVTINGGGMELIGTFGSAGIENGKLPNGDTYNWYKRRRP
jgi:hypothetical protein